MPCPGLAGKYSARPVRVLLDRCICQHLAGKDHGKDCLSQRPSQGPRAPLAAPQALDACWSRGPVCRTTRQERGVKANRTLVLAPRPVSRLTLLESAASLVGGVLPPPFAEEVCHAHSPPIAMRRTEESRPGSPSDPPVSACAVSDMRCAFVQRAC